MLKYRQICTFCKTIFEILEYFPEKKDIKIPNTNIFSRKVFKDFKNNLTKSTILSVFKHNNEVGR